MKKLLLILSIVFALSSCEKSQKINLIVDSSLGLNEDSPFLLNGYEIGEVVDIRAYDNASTFVEIKLTEDVQIPVDSKFTIEQMSMFGDSFVDLTIGISDDLISASDTVYGTLSAEPSVLKKGIETIVNNLIEYTDSLKQSAKE